MKLIPSAIKFAAARTVLTSQKHSPEALFAAGMIGFGTTVFLAAKATLKLEQILDRTEGDLHAVDGLLADPSATAQGYTEDEAKKAKVHICVAAGRDLTRLYGPAVVCGVLTVSALAGSQHILSKRNAALAAAYTTLDKAFGGYRDRVQSAIGFDKEKDLYEDVQMCEIENPETGKKSKRKVASGGSPYSFLFDEHNCNWEAAPEYNFRFLRLQQNYANQRLQARGHVFLNEVLDDLGLPHTTAGAVTGWIKGHGDDFIDFGLFNEGQEDVVFDFMVGREKAVWLSFNVDGTIYDKI